VFCIEHYHASKSFVALREVFCNANPDKEVPSRTINRLVTYFGTLETIVTSDHRVKKKQLKF
jgi:hypothetical protein